MKTFMIDGVEHAYIDDARAMTLAWIDDLRKEMDALAEAFPDDPALQQRINAEVDAITKKAKEQAERKFRVLGGAGNA
jgi:Ni,Fe-hydrogenase III large subunit